MALLVGNGQRRIVIVNDVQVKKCEAGKLVISNGTWSLAEG